MKKKLGVFVLIVMVVFAFAVVNASEDESGNWEMFSDNYYKVLKVNESEKIIVRRLEDSDYLEIEEAMVDTSKKAMSQNELETISKNEFSVLTDNVLPDGRMLKDNFMQIREEMLNEKSEVRLYGGNKAEDIQIEYKFADASINTKRIKTAEGYVVLPENPDDCKYQFAFSGDRSRTFISSNNGIWMLDAKSENPLQVFEMDSKQYKELSEESINIFGANYLIVNDAVLPSRNGEKVVFVTNKDDIKSGSSNLYISDIGTGITNQITNSQSSSYYPVKWIDENSILVNKFTSEGITLAIVGLDSSEIELITKVKSPIIYSVGEKHIAYTEQIGSEVIYIDRIDGDLLTSVAEVKCPGETRLRAGFNGFNKDESKFIALYKDSKNEMQSYICSYDIGLEKYALIENLPSGEDFVLECEWFDEDTIMVITGNRMDKATDYKTWLYHNSEVK